MMNSQMMNGGTLGAFSLGKMTSSQGEPIDNVHLEGSELVGYTYVYETHTVCTYTSCSQVTGWNYRQIRGFEFTNVQVPYFISTSTPGSQDVISSTTTNVYIYNIIQEPGADSDVWEYQIEVFNTNTWQWENECGGQNWNLTSVALQGRWNLAQGVINGGAKISSDANLMTFACTNAALGKCTNGQSQANGFGYGPWRSDYRYSPSSNSYVYTSRANMHQACTRMVRADYCGDGTPHTFTGNPIDVWDNTRPNYGYSTGINIETQADMNAGFLANDYEAAWKTNGAVEVWWQRIAGASQNDINNALPVITCPNCAVAQRCPFYPQMVWDQYGNPFMIHTFHAITSWTDTVPAFPGLNSMTGISTAAAAENLLFDRNHHSFAAANPQPVYEAAEFTDPTGTICPYGTAGGLQDTGCNP
jgi:hypothetical protein